MSFTVIVILLLLLGCSSAREVTNNASTVNNEPRHLNGTSKPQLNIGDKNLRVPCFQIMKTVHSPWGRVSM